MRRPPTDPRIRRERAAAGLALGLVRGLAAGLAGGLALSACSSPPPPPKPANPVVRVTRQFSPAPPRPARSRRAPPRRHERHRTHLRRPRAPLISAAQLAPDATVSGTLRAPGGPYLTDRYGRVVFLHGVNAVYKLAPYELTVEPGQPNSFTAADAGHIARLGFNVVRLGMLWEGLEPGHGGPDNPAVCTPGPPGDPQMFDAAVAHSYLAQLGRVVALLARDHIYTLLDMHQDLFSSVFGGEGAPAWAVCTDGLTFVRPPGRWSWAYASSAVDVADEHFWANDVVGDLQGQYDQVWAVAARYFRANPWVVGFDPYNEPFELELALSDTEEFASELQCFYAGRDHPGSLADPSDRLTCPTAEPGVGVVPTIERAAPHHLVFIEPDTYSLSHIPDLLGSMNLPDLVFNFHSYCVSRNPVTGDPTQLPTCENQVFASMLHRQNQLADLASPRQPGGPAWFMSEFGATQSAAMLADTADDAELLGVGWTEWAWKFWDDPTGSTHEGLVSPAGTDGPGVLGVLRTYAQAIAGRPVAEVFDPLSADYHLSYRPTRRVRAPTIIFVAVARYPKGWCTTVTGAHIVSGPSATHLLVANDRHAHDVEVGIEPGRCRPAGPR